MSVYRRSVPQLSKMLGNLERWLDEAVTTAQARGYDPEVLLTLRLAPDQFPLTRQIQSSCDAAKFAAARMAGRTAPSHPDTETTLAELRARIATTRAYLDTFSEADAEGAEERKVHLPALKGGWLSTEDYLTEFALPNFYFHVTTAYAILRHAGVPLGKRPYLGGMNVQAGEG